MIGYRTGDGGVKFLAAAKNERFSKVIAKAGRMLLPCGQCVGCRLEKSRQWAIRCMHESQMHENNMFITLTYDDKSLPPGNTLFKPDFQKFNKRLREHAWRQYGVRYRFYMCGEYGELLHRPHYHACIFGLDVPDRKFFSYRDGVHLYTSEWLDKIWGKGFTTVGDVTFESAAYCARYIMKKVTGAKAEEHYGIRTPEYTDMSRNGGIGKKFFEKHQQDFFPKDNFYVKRGDKFVDCRPPKYYGRMYEITHPEEMQRIKEKRLEQSLEQGWNTTEDRLNVRRVVKNAQVSKLKRTIE